MPRDLRSSSRRWILFTAIIAMLLLPVLMAQTSGTPNVLGPERQRGEGGPTVPIPQPIAKDWVAAHEAESSRLWFVELSSPPTIDGGDLTDLQREKDLFRNHTRQRGLVVRERRAFDVLWNGLSVEIDPNDLGKLKRLPGVVALYPIETITADPIIEESPGMATSLAMIGADVAQNDLGLRGTGVRVGIIDSGIDYDHPDLGGCFGEGCRVEVGWDYVGDDFTGPGSPVVPDADPDDCQGHGTHVAGIVGADGAVTGVAPGVTFGAYRVFGCEGKTTSDIMIAAMEQALADGMDIVNMSIGSARVWPQYPTAVAGTRLVNAGVVVAASFGNRGTDGLYGAGAPAVGEKVIGVASAINSHYRLPTFEVDGRGIPYRVMTDALAPPTIGMDPVVYFGRGCGGDPVENNPAGRVALIERGECTFREKVLIAVANGATGVIVHNNTYGVVFGSVQGTLPREVVGISQQDGMYLRSLDSPVIHWTDRITPGPLTLGGLISSFSSHGLSPDLQLKPDLTAPGGFIYSTYPLEKGGHATLSGTSMASPHVAGAAALLLEAYPHTPAQAVRGILQNSAEPFANRGGFDDEIPECVHRQGAGMMNISSAISADLKITPAKLSLGESEHGPAIRTMTLENRTDRDLIYDLTHQAALATEGVIDFNYLVAEANVTFDPPTIIVPASSTVSVSVTVEAPDAPEAAQYGGYVALTERDGDRTYRVPYAGLVGDYQSIRALSETPEGFPWLAKKSFWGRYLNRPFGESYTLEDEDRPYFLVHLDHNVRKLRFEVYDSTTGRSWHRASEFDYFRRNVGHRSWWVFSWDGFSRHGTSVVEVPNGTYRIRLAVQKALGEDDNPDHWEYWDSPVVTIARPGPGASREEGATSSGVDFSAPQQVSADR